MKIVLAFDSFKGCLSSREIIQIASTAIKKIIPQATICGFIIADGGEGTIEALIAAWQGKIICEAFHNLEGLSQPARLGFSSELCILECAQTLGLAQSTREQVELKTSRGLAEQIKFALDLGYRKFLIGLGGSGTNDAGLGMLEELGYCFRDLVGKPVAGLLKNIAQIVQIDARKVDPRLSETQFTILSDVTNPLCGINGASSVYGPQKGVRHEQVAEFDRGLLNFSQVSADFVGFNAANLAGAGAAGGLGYAFLQFLNTQLVSGVEYLLNALQIDSVIQAADLVLTGEGQSDGQTAQGKVALGVAIRAKLYNKPVLLISGALRPEAYQLHQHGIDFITSIQDYPAQLEQVMQAEVAAKLLGQRIEESLRLLLIGRSLSNKVS